MPTPLAILAATTALLSLLAGGPVQGVGSGGDPGAAAPSLPGELIRGAEDAAARMSVPVLINGEGPFRFTIDTGADRSVISAELAERLSLTRKGSLLVHGVNGSQLAPAAQVGSLEMGSRRLQGVTLPLLARADLGADGVLGLDALVDQRMVIDLAKSELRLEKSHRAPLEPGDIVVRAKSRYGQLVLVDSTLRNRPVYVILDSGSEVTIANSAFRRLAVERRRQATAPDRMVDILSVTGQTSEGAQDEAPELTLGGVLMRRVPVVYADLHTFAKFGLADEPAVLLGMDVLRAFRGVDVDFGRREVRFGFAHTQAARSITLNGSASRLR